MNQAYFNGNFWQCVTATSAGESPTTAAAKWRKIKIPSKWRWVLAQLTYAELLRLDGQNDKAKIESDIARGRDHVGLDELIRQEANEEHHSHCHRGGSARVNTGRTRPVDASVILEDANRLVGKDPTESDFDERDKEDGRTALSRALQQVWEAWWWQELMTCSRLRFASAYTMPPTNGAGQYVTGYVAYYQPADDYRMKMSDGDAGSPPTETDWYEWSAAPAERWSETTTYAVRDKVEYAGVEYYAIGAPSVGTAPPSDSAWVSIPEWCPQLPWVNTATAISTSHTPDAYTGPYGPVRSVSKFDPRISSNPQEFELDVTGDGTRVIGLTIGVPWVWARRVTPILTGDDFSSTATYEATDPQDLVYDS